MSVVLICFPGAPKVSTEAVKREADLDKYLEGRVEGRSKISFLELVDHNRTWDIDITIPFSFGVNLHFIQCKFHVSSVLHHVLK